MMNKPYTFWGRAYGIGVLNGKWALDPDDNPDNLPLVPKKYVEQALDYINYELQRKAEADAKREKELAEAEEKAKEFKPIPVEEYKPEPKEDTQP